MGRVDNSWGRSYEFVVVGPTTVYVDNMGRVDNGWGRSYEFVVVGPTTVYVDNMGRVDNSWGSSIRVCGGRPCNSLCG